MSDRPIGQTAMSKRSAPSLALMALATLVLLSPLTERALGADRFAAVVYAREYTDGFGAVRGARADAEVMADALRAAGYEVRIFADANSTDIRRAAYWLSDNLKAAGTEAAGVFYFVGHGAQINGRSYLLGVDAGGGDILSLTARAVPVDHIAEALGRSEAPSFLILDANTLHDAAREFRFEAGLRAFPAPAGGTVVLSAQPGAHRPVRAETVSLFAQHAGEMVQADASARAALSAFATAIRRASEGRESPWIDQRPDARLRFPSAGQPSGGPTDETAATTGSTLVGRVLLATDRGVVTDDGAPTFTDASEGRLIFADVQLGPLRPVLGGRAPDRFALMGAETFVLLARAEAGDGPSRALIVVPSFGWDALGAAEETRRLATQLGYDGAVVGFAWPSLAERTPISYQRDRAAVARSGVHLAALIQSLADEAEITEISLVTIGLGARAGAGALETLAATEAFSESPPLTHTVFLAPDAPSAQFGAQLSAARRVSQTVTVYVAPDDPTLTLAQTWAPDVRAGLAPPNLAPASRVDVIYAPESSTEPAAPTQERPSLVDDLRSLVLTGAPAALRDVVPIADDPELALDIPGAEARALGPANVWRLPPREGTRSP